MTIEIPGVNVNNGLDLCDGNTDIYLRFLQMYVSNMPKALAKMRNVSEETLHDYTIAVHGVKGISETIAADEIVKTARELEMMSKNGDLAGVLAQNDSFIKRAENLVDCVQGWLKKNNN